MFYNGGGGGILDLLFWSDIIIISKKSEKVRPAQHDIADQSQHSMSPVTCKRQRVAYTRPQGLIGIKRYQRAGGGRISSGLAQSLRTKIPYPSLKLSETSRGRSNFVSPACEAKEDHFLWPSAFARICLSAWLHWTLRTFLPEWWRRGLQRILRRLEPVAAEYD